MKYLLYTKGSLKNNFIPLKRDISASSYLWRLLNREVLETPPRRGYSCGFIPLKRDNQVSELARLRI